MIKTFRIEVCTDFGQVLFDRPQLIYVGVGHKQACERTLGQKMDLCVGLLLYATDYGRGEDYVPD